MRSREALDVERRHFARIVRGMVREIEDRIEEMEVGNPAFHGLTYQLGGLELMSDFLVWDPNAAGYPVLAIQLRDIIEATIQ